MSCEEEWRPVRGYEGIYEVSSLGRVRSLPRTIIVTGSGGYRAPKTDYYRKVGGIVLTPLMRTDGYYKVNLYRDGEREQVPIHRMVCEAFHGPPSAKQDAAHNDGVKINNHATNLRWASRAENMSDKIVHDTHGRGVRAHGAKLTDDDVLKIKEALRAGGSQSQLARQHGVSVSAIWLIAKQKNWAWLNS